MSNTAEVIKFPAPLQGKQESSMAELEKGYLRLANQIQDALCIVELSGREFRVLNAIVRLTYGWSKSSDRIANSLIADKTTLKVKHVSEAVLSLAYRNIIILRRIGQTRYIGINTSLDKWAYAKPNCTKCPAAFPAAEVVTWVITIPEFRDSNFTPSTIPENGDNHPQKQGEVSLKTGNTKYILPKTNIKTDLTPSNPPGGKVKFDPLTILVPEWLDSVSWGEWVADAIASMFRMVWHLITGAFTGDFQDAMKDAQNVFDSLIAFITGAFGVVGDAIKYVFGDAGEFVVDVFTTAIENTKLMFSALWKLVTGDFEGAWGDVVKIFDNGVELMKKPFTAFIDWAKNIFAGLGEYISNIISNAASNAWSATKSFFGFGEDEQQQGVTGGGNGGMSPDGIPYGMNAAVGIAGGGVTSNSSVSQQNTIHINTSDPVVAGNTAADSLQQNMKDANRLSGRGGR